MRFPKTVVSAVIAAMLAPALHAGQGAAAKPGEIRTKPGNVKAVTALRDALYAFDDDAKAKGGKADRTRLAELQKLVEPAKAEIRSFAARLSAAGETGAFDASVYERAQRGGTASAAAEIRNAGGAYAVLKDADSSIDAMIAARRRAAETALVDRWLERAGLTARVDAAAGCALFWYVISFGYGERFAYRSCYY